jgi:hypothetical protein
VEVDESAVDTVGIPVHGATPDATTAAAAAASADRTENHRYPRAGMFSVCGYLYLASLTCACASLSLSLSLSLSVCLSICLSWWGPWAGRANATSEVVLIEVQVDTLWEVCAVPRPGYVGGAGLTVAVLVTFASLPTRPWW